MEYLYIAMLLQEMGKEINVTNIQKILTDLDKKEADNKLQLVVSAFSVLMSSKEKEIPGKKAGESQKRFDSLENSLTSLYGLLADQKSEQCPACQNDHLEEAQPVMVEAAQVSVTDRPSEMKEPCQDTHDQPGRYVYGIGGKGVQEKLGAIGLDGNEVYTIPYKDVCIIVHDCPAEPYKSEDEDMVKDWLFTQQEVLDQAAERFEGVLPMGFDMIIEGKNGNDPEAEVISWLEMNYDGFIKTLSKIRNRLEYGVQVIMDTDHLSEKLIKTDEKIKKKKEEIDSKPEGIAYMEREILKDLIKERIEEEADQYFKDYYQMIKKCTDDIVIGKVKKVGGNQQMLMNLSCLVRKEMVKSLGDELEKIELNDELTVRFSGPWAPYSFVTPEKGVAGNSNE